jgi:HSP20 family molecular chaperone IbpA
MFNRTTAGYPVADIYTNEIGDTVMDFALAGFSKEELNVEVKPEDNTITVSAQASLAEGETDSRRIARRSFQKTYVNYNNKLDLTAVAATYENGLLTVTLPQSAEVAPLAIEIQ